MRNGKWKMLKEMVNSLTILVDKAVVSMDVFQRLQEEKLLPMLAV